MKRVRELSRRRPRGQKASVARPRRDRGFAYLMALFLVLAMIIASQVAAQNLLTEGRREREADMIWRGEQYARAIRLYYRKAGHYPQNLEELQKGLPDLHFLRYAATKDPMNTTDGEWGFIYVNPAGQLIGSSRYASLQQMALMDLNGGQLPTATIAGAVTASSLASPTQGTNSSTASGSSTGTSTFGPSSTFSSSPASGTPTSSAPAGGLFSTPGAAAGQKPTGPVDGPVLGAFLTGVVSKSPRSSVKVYHGGKKYSEWEFIWNPLEDQARAAQQGLAPQGAIPGQPGQPAGILGNLFGAAPGQGAGQGSSSATGGAVGANPAPQAQSPQQPPQ
jgi:hypothetical protein